MHLSTHYYVLSLNPGVTTLYEAFRDSLIAIDSEGFPVEAPRGMADAGPPEPTRLQELTRTVDKRFEHHFMLDPMRVVVVGESEMQSAFDAVTTHGPAVVGRVEGDHTTTSARDLGQITWPVVKRAMSGVLDQAMRDLHACAARDRVASGLEAVARLVNEGVRATLLVEDDYHMRGSILAGSRLPVVSADVDVREVLDDAVDAVIEKALEAGDNVVFMPNGSLARWDRIALLLRSDAPAR